MKLPRLRSPLSIAFPALLGALAAAPRLPAEWIWIEGEKPVKSSVNKHPWYDQVKRELLSGRDFISHFEKDRPGEAEYSVEPKMGGEYRLWVRANPVQARLSFGIDGGAWKKIDIEKGQQAAENIAGDGKIDLRFIAWIDAGSVNLAKGPHTIRFRMDSENQNHGAIDCFVLANEPFRPRGILKPGEAGPPDEEGWFAFDPGADPFRPGGLDLRSLNEKTAGDGGFIEAKGSRFVHSKTGEPVRFWAVNGPSPDARDRAALREEARFLAKRGVNLVRIHGGYYDEAGELQPEKVLRTIDSVEEFAAEGIYSHLSIYFPLWLKPKPDTPWLAGYDGTKHPFAALMFDPRFQERYRSWWKALLTRESPRTGKRLVDDPAVAGLEIQNEDSFFFWTFNAEAVPDPELRILEERFGKFLKTRYGSVDRALAKWGGVTTPRDDPKDGRVGFRPLWNMFNEKTLRDQDTVRFLVFIQREFYIDTTRFLRNLGFKGVITGSNWTTASPAVFGPLEKFTYTACDFIDRHGYFGGIHKGDNAEWSIRDGHTYTERSALRFDPAEPGKPRVFEHPVMDPSYGGKPSMISETTFERPNRYRSEAPLFYAAYGALQGTDAVVHFALDGARWGVKPGYFMQPWTLMSPAMMGQFPAAALIYRQGLVAEGDLLAQLNLRLGDLEDLKGTPLPQGAALDELRLKDVPLGGAITAASIIDPLIHLAGRVDVRITAKGAPAAVHDLEKFIDRQKRTVTSTTGELKLDYGKGVLRIDAPAAQGLCGDLRAAGPAELKDLTIASDLDLAHVVAVSLDGQPLAGSVRILLQVMSEERSSGFRTEKDGDHLRIASIGHDPWMVRDLRGTVKFKRPDAAKLEVKALDPNGDPVRVVGSAAEVRLAPDVIYYLIAAPAK